MFRREGAEYRNQLKIGNFPEMMETEKNVSGKGAPKENYCNQERCKYETWTHTISSSAVGSSKNQPYQKILLADWLITSQVN